MLTIYLSVSVSVSVDAREDSDRKEEEIELIERVGANAATDDTSAKGNAIFMNVLILETR